MLGYVIALMVAWPIVGYIAGVSVLMRWFYKTEGFIDSSDAYMTYANQIIAFDENENNEIVKLVPKGNFGIDFVDTRSNKVYKFDRVFLNAMDIFILWPSGIRLLNKRCKAAYEHFKSGT